MLFQQRDFSSFPPCQIFAGFVRILIKNVKHDFIDNFFFFSVILHLRQTGCSARSRTTGVLKKEEDITEPKAVQSVV